LYPAWSKESREDVKGGWCAAILSRPAAGYLHVGCRWGGDFFV